MKGAIIITVVILALFSMIKAQSEDGLVKHSVFFRFQSNVTVTTQREVMKRFLALKQLCVNPSTGEPYIVDLIAGTANSPEGADQKMTQGFIVTFKNISYRNYYVGRPFFNPFDPAHDDFKAFVVPLLDEGGGFVFDFTVGTMPN